MNTCEMQLLLNRYFDDELPSADRAGFERHLCDCAPCTAELQQLRGISSALHGLQYPTASADFLQRLETLSENVPDVMVMRFTRRLTAVAAAILVAATCHWAIVNRESASKETAAASLTRMETAMVDPDSAATYENASSNAQGDVQLDPLMSNLAGGRQ